jgi:hypothetical protein
MLRDRCWTCPPPSPGPSRRFRLTMAGPAPKRRPAVRAPGPGPIGAIRRARLTRRGNVSLAGPPIGSAEHFFCTVEPANCPSTLRRDQPLRAARPLLRMLYHSRSPPTYNAMNLPPVYEGSVNTVNRIPACHHSYRVAPRCRARSPVRGPSRRAPVRPGWPGPALWPNRA